MSKRRGNGEGSIYERQPGRWCAQIQIKYATGEIKRKTVYGKTQKEVISKLEIEKSKRKEYRLLTSESMLLRDWITKWLDEYKSSEVRQTTLDFYRSLINNHIIPQFGDYLLADLSAPMIQTIYSRWQKSQKAQDRVLSKKTIHHIHVTLKAALTTAKGVGLISSNPVEGCVPPKGKEPKKKDIPSLIEMKNILEYAKGHRHELLLKLLIVTGMRRGEALALRWSDIQWTEKYLRVRQNLVKTTQGKQFQQPKTSSSVRMISLTDNEMSLLQEQRNRIKSEKSANVSYYQDNNLVFCNEIGEPIYPDVVSAWFKKIVNKAGVSKELSIHALRHFHTTMLLESGVPVKLVQNRLGHSSAKVTLDIYAHVTANMQDLVREKLTDITAELMPTVFSNDAPILIN